MQARTIGYIALGVLSFVTTSLLKEVSFPRSLIIGFALGLAAVIGSISERAEAK